MFLVSQIKNIYRAITTTAQKVNKIQEALGRLELVLQKQQSYSSLQSNEFRVFSQWGEDGIIQKLIRHIRIENKIFIEFGVENYTESNTRFLLINNNWSGLVFDGLESNINFIKKDRIYWEYNLKAECNFITKENINSIFIRNGISGDIGILSIDIDGNDYWVWDAINVVNPAIVITEYNGRFPVDMAVTVPYEPDFVRAHKHHSMIYYGASLAAMNILAKKKGYAFVGCNSAGNNAFFVKRDLMVPEIKELDIREGYVANNFRESRDSMGKLNFLSRKDELDLLKSMPLVLIEE